MSVSIALESITCIDEVNEASASEEPYVLVTSIDLSRPVAQVEVFRYGVWEDFDEGETRQNAGPDFWGVESEPANIATPSDAGIVVTLLENDNGVPDQYRQLVKTVATTALAASIGSGSTARLNKVTADIRAVLDGDIAPPIPFLFDDDHVATLNLPLGPGDILPGARAKTLSVRNDEGAYDLTFRIKSFAWNHNAPSFVPASEGVPPNVIAGTSLTSWYTPKDDVQHLGYVGTDQKVHELFFFLTGGDRKWHH
ncbi:hypothetical protein, partial [Streptomyces lavenduligriseus]